MDRVGTLSTCVAVPADNLRDFNSENSDVYCNLLIGLAERLGRPAGPDQGSQEEPMAKLSIAFSLLLAASTFNPLSATVLCPTADVTTLSTGCSLGSFDFNDFVVDYSSGFSSVTMGISSAYSDGSDAVLEFSIVTNPSPVTDHMGEWARIGFNVSAPWIHSVGLQNVDGNQVWIFETLCKSSFAANYGNCPDADLLGTMAAGDGMSASLSFAPVDHLFVLKQPVFGDASITSMIQRFSNAPEPATMLIVGVPLVLIALLRRKKGAMPTR